MHQFKHEFEHYVVSNQKKGKIWGDNSKIIMYLWRIIFNSIRTQRSATIILPDSFVKWWKCIAVSSVAPLSFIIPSNNIRQFFKSFFFFSNSPTKGSLPYQPPCTDNVIKSNVCENERMNRRREAVPFQWNITTELKWKDFHTETSLSTSNHV